jgi:hypothetical protein
MKKEVVLPALGSQVGWNLRMLSGATGCVMVTSGPLSFWPLKTLHLYVKGSFSGSVAEAVMVTSGYLKEVLSSISTPWFWFWLTAVCAVLAVVQVKIGAEGAALQLTVYLILVAVAVWHPSFTAKEIVYIPALVGVNVVLMALGSPNVKPPGPVALHL